MAIETLVVIAVVASLAGQENSLGRAIPTARLSKSHLKTTTIERTTDCGVAVRHAARAGIIGLLASHAMPSVGRRVLAVISIVARTRSPGQSTSRCPVT